MEFIYMANVLPTDLIAGYTSDGTNITIPLASLTGLSAAEAAADTGDGREVIRVLLETVLAAYNALTTEQRPTELTITRSNPTPQGPTSLRYTYTVQADIDINPLTANMTPEA